MRPSGLHYLRRWETLLAVCLLVVLGYNVSQVPNFLTVNNQVNLFQLGIEKAIVVLAMTFVIISGEIDLSVASMMGLAAAIVAYAHENEWPFVVGILLALSVGAAVGLINGFLVAKVGISSLAVTLAGYIGLRGLAEVLVEDKSIGGFPEWFNKLGQEGLVGPITFSIIAFWVLAAIAIVVLHYSAFGRWTYAIGNSKEVSRYSGVPVAPTKMTIFMMSSLIASFAGILYAARLGSVRASTAQGFELDIITMVLLGGVSIFGGIGSMVGVLLSVYLVLNLRNGLTIAGVTGNTQTGIIGLLLILSVLIPNMVEKLRDWSRRRQTDPSLRAPPA